MPRNRMIKPQFWDDSKIAKISRDARLLYIGMWNFCDDLGVIRADMVWLKSKIFPFDQIQIQQFEKICQEILRNGFISLFSYRGEEFYYLPKFSLHQKINKPNFEDVNVPKELLFKGLSKITEQSRNNHGLITEQSIPKIEIEEEIENNIIPPTPPKGFEDLEKVISEKDHALNEALARIKELEEKIAKDNPAKPKRANSLNANARKAFEEHFRNTFGEEYYWTAKDAGNMSQLLRKLTFSREQRHIPVDDASVLYALQVFLTSVKDSWLLDNFSVANINSKYNEIVSKAKNGNSGKGTIGSTTTGPTEKFICSKAEKGADRESDRAPQKDYSSRF